MSDLLLLIICYPLLDCLVAPAICSAIADCLRILVASSMPCSRLAVALPLPCRCLAVALPSPCHCLADALPSPHPPFCPPSSSSRLPLPPHKDSDGDGDRHWCRRSSLSLLVLLPPPTPFFPLPSQMSLSPLSGCVHHSGCSGGTASPAVIRDGPGDRMTKAHYGTTSAASSASAAAMEATEEEYKGCDDADPQCHLDDTFLSLADGILHCSIVATTAGATAMVVGSTATATMLMPTIYVVMVHWVGGLGGYQRQQRRDGQQ